MPVTPAIPVSTEQPGAAGAGPALPTGTERRGPVLPRARSGTARASPPQWFIPAASFPPKTRMVRPAPPPPHAVVPPAAAP